MSQQLELEAYRIERVSVILMLESEGITRETRRLRLKAFPHDSIGNVEMIADTSASTIIITMRREINDIL